MTLRWRARDAAGVLSRREGVVTVNSACRAGYRRASFWWDPDQCMPCPAGRFNQEDAIDQDGCAPCDAGSYAPHAASTQCHMCPSSTFSDKPGAGSCDTCADIAGNAMVTVSAGASTRRQCLCPKGSWVDAANLANTAFNRRNASSIWWGFRFVVSHFFSFLFSFFFFLFFSSSSEDPFFFPAGGKANRV